MRRLGAVLCAAGLVPALIALPTFTAPAAHPHPVKESMQSLPLAAITSLAGPRIAGTVAPGTTTASVKQFQALAVTWLPGSRPTQVTVSVRVHSVSGSWSGWQTVADQDIAPDGNGVDAHRQLRVGTDLLWVGPSDGVQVRVDDTSGPPPRDMRVDLINPGTSAADASPGPGSAPAGSALAAPAEPTIYTRAQWGADESLRRCFSGYSPTVQVEFVHHSDTTNSYSPAQVPAIIRSIYYYHVVDNGWCDIGYNYLVDRFGRIWEGRWGGIGRPVIGAHTGGFNYDSFGVVLIGTYDSVSPSSAELSALERLSAWELSIYHRNPAGTEILTAASFNGARYAAGQRVRFNTISGHRDADYTDCPGGQAYALLPTVRAAAHSLLGAGLVDPSVSTALLQQGAGGGFTITAGATRSEYWRLYVFGPDAANILDRISGFASGTFRVTWTGLTASGAPAPPGRYTLGLANWSGGDTGVPYYTSVEMSGPSPSVVATGPGAGELFYTAPNGQVLYRSFSFSPGTAPVYGAAVSLGGRVYGGPAAVQLTDGEFEVFGRGEGGTLYGNLQTGPSTWTGWFAIGGPFASPPSAVAMPDGTAEVFLTNASGNTMWAQVSGRTASAFTNLGGVTPSTPAVSAGPNGVVEVFARSPVGVLYRGQLAGSTWSGYGRLSALSDIAPAAAFVAGTGPLFLFGRDAATQSLLVTQFDPATATWSAATNGGGALESGPGAAAWPSGDVEAFVVGVNGWMYEKALTSGSWSGWRAAFMPGVS